MKCATQQQLNSSTSAGYKIKILTTFLLLFSLQSMSQVLPLKISTGKRFFSTSNGDPFYWLGDTGWLLFVKCNRKDAIQYLDERKKQGFNVIQAMLLHDFNNTRNVYNKWALINYDVSKPNITTGNDAYNSEQYDYWDHVEYIVDEAGKRGMYMALVPVWGSNVKGGKVSVAQAQAYGEFLAKRLGAKPNIIWLNGGDVNGGDKASVWNALGTAIKKYDGQHIMTFHPRGRFSSSDWFHNEPWLDFNMFQSGHKSYEQDTSSKEQKHYGEDNWRYVQVDYALKPVKPTIDGEPSYEEIPYGLHDSTTPYWHAPDIRRYAYWSVLEGGSGFTYGHNAVMQFYMPGDTGISFFPKQDWKTSLTDPGAMHMKHLKKLMATYSFEKGKPLPQLVLNNGERYNHIACYSTPTAILLYSYIGSDIAVAKKLLPFRITRAYWYNVVTGKETKIPLSVNATSLSIASPLPTGAGNDWVCILKK